MHHKNGRYFYILQAWKCKICSKEFVAAVVGEEDGQCEN